MSLKYLLQSFKCTEIPLLHLPAGNKLKGLPQKLKLLTFNVWFDADYRQERFAMFTKIIIQHKPDIVCLQEVTPEFFHHLFSLMNKVYWFSTDEQDVPKWLDPYGVLTLVRKDFHISNAFQYTLPSEYGRNLLCVELDWCVQQNEDGSSTTTADAKTSTFKLAVCTVHLESGGSAPTREKQIEIISARMRAHNNVILCGDFNFDSTKNYRNKFPAKLENECLTRHLTDYHDCWPLLHPNEKGYTFDTIRNGMLREHPEEQMRYDRVMFKTDSKLAPKLAVKSIEIVGDEAMGVDHTENLPIFPSDHFGLLAEFDIQ